MIIREKFSSWAAIELHPTQLVRSLITGVLLYAVSLIFAISFAALIFADGLASQLPTAVGLIVAGSAAVIALLSLFSSYAGTVAKAQEAPVAILAITAAAMLRSMPAGTPNEQVFLHLVLMIISATLLTGFFFVLLGFFKLGGLVRYLPYPVMGGFLAATGWFLFSGGIHVMVGDSTISGITLFQEGILSRWFPGLLFSLLLVFVSMRTKSGVALPATIIATLVLFYLIVRLFDIPFAQLSAQGWVLGQFSSGALWQFPFDSAALMQTDWSFLSKQLFQIVPILIISAIALLLNANGVELIVRKDIDLNHELIITGFGNLIGGLFGNVVSFHSVSLTTLNHSVSGGKRLPGLLAALLLGLSAFLGASALAYIPRFVLGGLLMMLGLTLLINWVYRAWFTFPRVEFLIILLILAVTAFRGFLEGVVFGLIAAVIMFVVSYSTTSVVRHALSGTAFKSRITRSHHQRVALDGLSNRLYILQLQGFIFFGTASSLFEEIRNHARQATTQYVVLDFARVSGMDSTGLLSFSKLLQTAQEEHFTLVLTGMTAGIRMQFSKGGFREQPGSLHIFTNLDRGVEWCENQLLLATNHDQEPPMSLQAQLEAVLPGGQISRLIPYLSRREVTRGQYLIHQGDEPDHLFFIESGQVTAQIETPNREPVRLETMRGGRAVGELGFYLGSRRTAAVVADEPGVVYSLSQKELHHIEKVDPEAANGLHRLIVHLLGERVVHLIRAVDALQD